MRSYGSLTTSATLTGAALGLLFVQLFALPPWLLPHGTGWAWLLIPLVLTSTPLWSLLHESIHGSLLRDRTLNDRIGRALAVGYGAPFALLKAGHLLHHRYSRTPRERTEVYDPAVTSWTHQATSYYVRLFGGLYLAEVASIPLALLPRPLWKTVARRLSSPETVTTELLENVAARRITAFRVDALLIVLVYAGAFAAYGTMWWMLLIALGGRALVISVSDNAYHYGTPLDAPLEAMNLKLPRPVEAFVLAFNLHGVHHLHPGLAWHDLRAAFLAEGGRFDLGWFRALTRQARGPIPATSPALRQPAAATATAEEKTTADV